MDDNPQWMLLLLDWNKVFSSNDRSMNQQLRMVGISGGSGQVQVQVQVVSPL